MNKFLLTLALSLATAGAWGHEGHEPAETDFKSDTCAECGMAVTSKSYAAQMVTDDGAVFFDDIGCLVQYERQGKIDTKAVHVRYVRSAAADAWLDVTKAAWVLTRDVRTPMGYGLHAFADRKAADAFAKTKKGALSLTWSEVPAAVPERDGAMSKMGKM